ncbi:MAG: multidrug efflux RND transporter permease subunit [Verrucomicrobiaceae bacterium]|nr:multidrug efflux RND transporter permease subunit [Verrucomicrobiaceae bacterium]
MKFSHFFIDRPIFAAVISIVITLLGIVGYVKLPVAQYPDVVPPSVTVTTQYAGASPEIIMQTVAAPIEQEINGVEKMIYMFSQCNSDGSLSTTVTFELGTNIDIAQVQVQNRVAIATPRLPEEVRNFGVTVNKKSPDMLLCVSLFSPDNSRDKLYLTNYAITQMKDRLARVYGVGSINIFGAREYSMRIWLNPEKLEHVNMTPAEVAAALREQNKQVAAGKLNQEPIANSDAAYELIINTQGRLSTPEEFKKIIVKYDDEGRVVRLEDVATVELGAYTYGDESKLNGRDCVTMAAYQLPGSNALDTAKRLREVINEMAASFPVGVDYKIALDNTEYIENSISAVYHTIYEAVLLVVLVMMIFLQNWRAAIIPIFAIPVSLIGTFFFMMLFGFSINNLSLFGLVLAIGIVVDDAIVVVENVERNMHEGLNAREATKKAMTQVQGALIAIAFVLSAVFVPTAFIEGISGQFYRQFALTIAASTIISAIVSLTLSPALCAILMKEGEKPDWFTRIWNFCFGWFFKAFNTCFFWCSEKYGAFVKRLLRFSIIVLVAYAGMLYWTGHQFQIVPRGFIPKQDTGYIFGAMQLPDGVTLDHTRKAVDKARDIISKIEGIEDVTTIAGLSGATFTKLSNAGALFIRLRPKEERVAKGITLESLLGKIYMGLKKGVPESNSFVLTPPAVNGIGMGGDFKCYIQDRTGRGIADVAKYTHEIARKAMTENPEISLAFSTYRISTPQLYVNIDRERAQKLNVPIRSIFETMQFNLGSVYVNDFNILNRVYRVSMQAEGSKRSDIPDIYNLKVPSRSGGNVPMGSVATIKRIVGPDTVNRYNLYPSAEIMGNLGAGYSTGEAMAVIERVAAETLPSGMGMEWTDLAYQEKLVGNTAIIIFGLCVVFVFLILAALYESWTLPLTIILIVPLVLLFALLGIDGRGLDNNLMTQIGMVVLIGLACKNAILIVEFAKQRQEKGEEIVSATAHASQNRLRPILMTSFAFILGVVPLAFSLTSGSELRQPLGTAVMYGMLGVTFMGLIFTPVFFYVIRKHYKPSIKE